MNFDCSRTVRKYQMTKTSYWFSSIIRNIFLVKSNKQIFPCTTYIGYFCHKSSIAYNLYNTFFVKYLLHYLYMQPTFYSISIKLSSPANIQNGYLKYKKNIILKLAPK